MTPTLAAVVAGVFGACVGSFLNVVIWRLPRGKSVADGRSHCPRCGHLIRWHDNVPVLAWILLRARCRDCRAPISARYPFVEALTAALFVLAALRHPFPDETAVAAVKALLLAALVVVAFVDVDRREIPDAITKPGIVVGLVASFLVPALHAPPWLGTLGNAHLTALFEAAIGVAVGGGVLLLIRWVGRAVMGKEAMGLGDVKLLAMVGAFARPLDVLYVLLLASVGGSVVGGAFVAGRGRTPAPLAGTVALGGGPRAAFARALVRAPRRRPVTVGALVAADLAREAVVGARATLDLTLPGATVWSDDGKDVALALRGVVEAVDPRGAETLVTVRPEPLAEADEEYLATFALHRISIPFGVFLALGAAAVLLYGASIDHFMRVTWPHLVTGR